jgi:EmrB/QacA subfamily drug resistance transporter
VTNERSAAPATGADDDPPYPTRWRALAVCLVGNFMVLLDVSVVNVAQHSITLGLGASAGSVQWTLSGYALTYGLFLVPSGRLGDVLGRRRMFLIALVLFAVTSAACGAAPTPLLLVIARLVQGIAGGMITPQVVGLIQQMFRGTERGRAFGMIGAVIGIATALGPVVGGALIAAFGQHDGWRFVFLINVPVALVALPFAIRLIPGAPPGPAVRRRYDPVGVLLLGVAVLLVLLPFVQEQQWPGAAKWLLLPAAVVVGALFVLWERRQDRHDAGPLLDLALFRRRSVSLGIVLITCYFAGFMPLLFVLSLLLQNGEGYSALLTGLASVPFAVGSGISSALSGHWVARWGRQLVVAGLVVVAVGYGGVILVVHLFSGGALGGALILPLLVSGFGSGIVISPNQTVTLTDVPVAQGGATGGLLQTGQRLGTAIGIATVGSAFYGRLAHGGAAAMESAMTVAIAFVLVALVFAGSDVWAQRRTALRAS